MRHIFTFATSIPGVDISRPRPIRREQSGMPHVANEDGDYHERDWLQSELAMRAEADKLQGVITDFAIDKDEVRSNMAIAMILPFASERMVTMALRERLIGGQKV
jgi:hypothetical protein